MRKLLLKLLNRAQQRIHNMEDSPKDWDIIRKNIERELLLASKLDQDKGGI